MRSKALATVLLSASVLALASSDTSAAIDRRTYVAGSYALYVDGAFGAHLPSVAGGGAGAQTVVDRAGSPGAYPKKHVGNVVYDDITFALDRVPEKPLLEWMKTTIGSAQQQRKNGYFSSIDPTSKEFSRTSWTGGVISDITFPDLDAASKDVARIQLTISPERTTFTQANANKVDAAAPIGKAKSALFSSNFRLTVGGFEAQSRYISHVEPMSVRYKVVQAPVGEMRDYEKTTGQVDVSNLAFTVTEAQADPFYKWHDDFVVKGKNSDADEKTAVLELLTPDLKTAVYKLTMKGVGIVKIGPEKTSTESVRRVRVEAYVESLQLDSM